jgi:inorganic pyrophosphatase
VPINKLTTMYHHVNNFRDLPKEPLNRIARFFDHDKDLEPGKWVNITGCKGPEEAKREILASADRYQQAAQKPAF